MPEVEIFDVNPLRMYRFKHPAVRLDCLQFHFQPCVPNCFPAEVLPFHSRLEDPAEFWITSSEQMWTSQTVVWMREVQCTYWGTLQTTQVSFCWPLPFEKCCTVHLQGVTLLPPSAVMFTVLFDIYVLERSNIFVERNLDFMQIVGLFF